ncbi:MAG: tetratricopeptide repeat protein [Lentisphaerae bacterium]|nr:tetratricopeptide repeat protein [Lentisphaerota bacterium]
MDEQNTDEEVGQPEELEQLLLWLRKRGTPLAAGALIVLALVAAVLYARRRSESGEKEALVMLSSSRNIQEFESIATEYPDSPAAPLALLRAAKGHYDVGSYAMAIQKYSDFLETYADHVMAAAAELGKIHCTEAMGQTEKALLDFIAFANERPNNFLNSQAVLGQGRCLEQLRRYEEARTLYEDFLAEHADGPWTLVAEERLELVNGQLRRAARPAVSVGPLATEAPGNAPDFGEFTAPLSP